MGTGPLFITFEGTEGSGKSTQSRILYRKLCRHGVQAVLTAEPGGTPLGLRIRALLKGRQTVPIAPASELLLFNAARAQLVETVIRPSLLDGKVVICDRYVDSTIAYQGFGRALDLELVHTANTLATGGLRPDLTILLDLPPGIGLGRKNSERLDRFEVETLAFHERVRTGYLTAAACDPHRWLILDARQEQRVLGDAIWSRVCERLPLALQARERAHS